MDSELDYLALLEDICEEGVESTDRTGVGTRKIFGSFLKFDLREDVIPVLTTKKIYWKAVVEELLWFIRGSTNAKLLSNKGVNIWDGNSSRTFLDERNLEYPAGFIGPGYGHQWRNWGGKYVISSGQEQIFRDGINISSKDNSVDTVRLGDGVDQLQDCLYKLKHHRDDRRIIVSAWNVSQLHEMALPPCHLLFQFGVLGDELHCTWYQRSVDTFLGLPFNIASYGLLTHLMAKAAGLKPGTITFFGADVHIYNSHLDAVAKQLDREVEYGFPTIEIPNVSSLEDIEQLDYTMLPLINYHPQPAIKAPMAV